MKWCGRINSKVVNQVRWVILKVSLSMRSSESMELQEYYALNVNNGRKIKAVKSLQAIVK